METDITLGGKTPPEYTESLSSHQSCMRGTNQPHPRCIALSGIVGQEATCGIYDNRPSPCEDFGVHWVNGEVVILPDDLIRCNRARAHYNLPPLDPS